MDFKSVDTKISIKCDCYCFLFDENHCSLDKSKTEIMKIYWSYSNSDGWGSVSDEYISVNDIRKLKKELFELECCKRHKVDMDFYGAYEDRAFISLHLEKIESLYYVDMKVYDGTFDEYIAVSCSLTKEEWRPCYNEWMEWNRTYSLHLGDKVETLVHYDDRIFPLGRVGEVTEIYPETEKSPVRVGVSFTDIDWRKKPYQSTRLYDLDEVRRISEV